MRTNLPREMNFTIEAENAARTVTEFANIQTALYIPKVISASRRILVMERVKDSMGGVGMKHLIRRDYTSF